MVEQPPPYPGVMGMAGGAPSAPPPAYVTPNGTAYMSAPPGAPPMMNPYENQVRITLM